jgi:hypothetical protein
MAHKHAFLLFNMGKFILGYEVYRQFKAQVKFDLDRCLLLTS